MLLFSAVPSISSRLLLQHGAVAAVAAVDTGGDGCHGDPEFFSGGVDSKSYHAAGLCTHLTGGGPVGVYLG